MEKASYLYTEVANTWKECQFQKFLDILRETGNYAALEILTADGAEVFVDKNIIDILKSQMNSFTKEGCYEGLSLEDEKLANEVQSYCGDGKIFQNGRFKLSEELDRSVIVFYY